MVPDAMPRKQHIGVALAFWAAAPACITSCKEEPPIASGRVDPSPLQTGASTLVGKGSQPARDFAGEFESLRALPIDGRGAKLLALYRDWGSRSGEVAIEHAIAHGSALASASLREALHGWHLAAPEAARGYVSTEPNRRRARQLGIAYALVLPTEERRAELALALGDPEVRAAVLSQAVARWAASPRPGDGLRWLARQDGMRDGDRGLLADATGDLVRIWARRDPGAASGSLIDLPPGELRDAAAGALAIAVAADEPGAARSWAESIASAERRASVLAIVDKVDAANPSPAP